MIKTKFKNGLGLIEIMAVTVIIGLVSTGTVTIFLTGEKMVSEIGRKLEAYSFCQQTMEELISQGYSLSSPPDPTLPDDSILKTYFQGNRTYKIEKPPGTKDVKKITVRATWREGSKDKEVTLVTLLTKHEDNHE